MQAITAKSILAGAVLLGMAATAEAATVIPLNLTEFTTTGEVKPIANDTRLQFGPTGTNQPATATFNLSE